MKGLLREMKAMWKIYSNMKLYEIGKMLVIVVVGILSVVGMKIKKFLVLRKNTKPVPSRYALNEKDNFTVTSDDFRKHMAKLMDVMINYVQKPDEYNVLPTNIRPGYMVKKMPKTLPKSPDSFDNVLSDVKNIILPGMLHWQHPRFFGYVPLGFSWADVLGEALVSTLGTIAFSWDAGPSLAELEITVINWVANLLDLPKCFHYDTNNCEESPGGGALANSASDAIYNALLTSRRFTLDREMKKKFGKDWENMSSDQIHQYKCDVLSRMVCYYSDQAHSSIEKGCTLALVISRKILVTSDDYSMSPKVLEEAIKEDIAKGFIPFHLHITGGTTNLGTVEPIGPLADVAKMYDMWVHVDGALGGPAMACPELRSAFNGIEKIDSINVNMSKMLLMTCAACILWCRHQKEVVKTFAIHPPYLARRNGGGINDFRHWGISLSRRPYCIPIWFMLRMVGEEGIRRYIRKLIHLREVAFNLISVDPRFEIVGRPSLSIFGFRYRHENQDYANYITKHLCEYINQSGRLYFTSCTPRPNVNTIRVNIIHQLSDETDIQKMYEILNELTEEFLEKVAVPEQTVFVDENNNKLPCIDYRELKANYVRRIRHGSASERRQIVFTNDNIPDEYDPIS